MQQELRPGCSRDVSSLGIDRRFCFRQGGGGSAGLGGENTRRCPSSQPHPVGERGVGCLGVSHWLVGLFFYSTCLLCAASTLLALRMFNVAFLVQTPSQEGYLSLPGKFVFFRTRLSTEVHVVLLICDIAYVPGTRFRDSVVV